MSEMANTKERSGEFARIAIAALEEKKATEIRVIDISEVSAGAVLKQVEGYDNASWILMDFGDVIVHIFGEQDRLLYDLERIWRDGKQMDPDQL